MKKLKLPLITNFPEQNKWLSMNEYIKFINFNATNFQKRKNNKKFEINMHTGAPFLIK